MRTEMSCLLGRFEGQDGQGASKQVLKLGATPAVPARHQLICTAPSDALASEGRQTDPPKSRQKQTHPSIV